MFKDTPDGQTYHDPEAERKAREPMQDLIKESASEFDNEWDKYSNGVFNSYQEAKAWHTKQMEKVYNKGLDEGRKEEGSSTREMITRSYQNGYNQGLKDGRPVEDYNG